jgi:NADH:ubiquinone oxidoreductase subunit 3 (subunit A)
MNPRIAGFFSVALILAAVVITIMALYTYSIRLTELEQTQQSHLTTAEKKEKQFKMVYFLVGIVIIVIELSLCMVIILGAFHSKIS